MAVRSTMAALIARVRLLVNDSSGSNQQFSDQDILNVLDASRTDVLNGRMMAKPTFSGTTIQYLDYFTDLGDWEDDLVLKQYLTLLVTPSVSEPIVGHFQFATSTLPPVFITGKTYDVYRAAADLLDRLAARWAMSYNMSVDGQSLQRGQVAGALQNLARTYRMQQRAGSIIMSRTDQNAGNQNLPSLGPTELDYMSSGNGR